MDKSRLTPITEYPNPGDIVYHDSGGLVKCRVTDQYSGKHRETYPELILVETIEDYGEFQWFRPGHQSVRGLTELFKEIDPND